MTTFEAFDDKPPVGDQPHLCCTVGDVEYALPLQAIRRVEAMPITTRFPFAPGWHAGFVAVDGQPLTALDLGMLLGGPPLVNPRYLIVVEHKQTRIALPVESISTIVRIASGDLSTTALNAADRADAVAMVWCPGERAVTILSVPGLFHRLAQKEGDQA